MAAIQQIVSTNQPDEEYYEDETELKTVPVYEIDGDVYQEFRTPSEEEWELSVMWKKHTASSKAKDWGKIKAGQSRPIQALYQRSQHHENVPAFKQYDANEVNNVTTRVQRMTKSALLRHRNKKNKNDDIESKTSNSNSGSSASRPASNEDIRNQQELVKRLLRPTASQELRRELTAKYRPKPKEQEQ